MIGANGRRISSNVQGAVGHGAAQYICAMNGWKYFPLPVDSAEPYDAIIKRDSKLERWQIKTTTHCTVSNPTAKAKYYRIHAWCNKSKKPNLDASDYFFIWTSAGDLYLIPSQIILSYSTDRIKLSPKFNKYLIGTLKYEPKESFNRI